jgi:hypothetical protein
VENGHRVVGRLREVVKYFYLSARLYRSGYYGIVKQLAIYYLRA